MLPPSHTLADVLAGLSVACMEIPQGMSYAALAGLPNVFGLYGATIPCIVYCIFGSSPQLAVGPVSVTSMLLGTGLATIFQGRVNHDPNAPDDPLLQQQYNQAAIQVAFLVGVLYTAISLLRLGWLTNFLSHSVVSGFMSGASISIAASQLKTLLGIKLPRGHHLQAELHDIFTHLKDINYYELLMGLVFISVLLTFKLLAGKHKGLSFLSALGPFTVAALSIGLMNAFKLYEQPSARAPYIQQVGPVPSGLPGFTAGWWLPLRAPGTQLTLAMLVCLIDAVEAMSMAKILARVSCSEHDATQDLQALGLANLAGAAFSCYNTTGSFSRSAVNKDAGARTPLASGVCGAVLALTLLFCTGLFTHMSKNVQGAIILVGVLRLFDGKECAFLYRVNKPDCVVWLATFVFTMFLGVFHGIVFGVALALMLVIYKTACPRIATLGRLPGSCPGVYRNREMYEGTLEEPGMLLLRVDCSIYFANAQSVRAGVCKAVQKALEERPLQVVVLNLSPVIDIDASAVHALHGLVDQLQAQGLVVALVNPSQQVVTLLRRSQLLEKVGDDNIHVSMHGAVLTYVAVMQSYLCPDGLDYTI
ncbi:hypothetical protein N2152v2_003064 [Parachlorella kessleri]